MSANAVTLADISSADWSLELDITAGGASGAGIGKVVQGVADVDQCIGIILSTPLGSDPLRPKFGLDQGLYVDVPLTHAASTIPGPAKIAIETWEPRLTVNSVSVVADASSVGHIIVTVNWQLKAAPTQQGTTSVNL